MAAEQGGLAEEIERQVWAGYSEQTIDHARNPRNVGSIADADGFASVDGSCGDNLEIWVKVRDGIIQEATFWTDGCATTVAAGSMITELAKGKPVGEALQVTERQVLEALGWLPEDSHHCVVLAVSTLRAALANYLARRAPFE
ncbi:MAG: iron-sulfur cluster assembly scaffold protein [Chloroflexi bacterium]|nr:iron-sulfur cluster assembly scaffold protein [Chloroflexota bacterium]MCL5107314.1 iron-sulfur cluster assembly scaffold protein [Chloroflexota bacterium]